jgi:low affinity Fe/Cu permease
VEDVALSETFRKLAAQAAHLAGTVWAFALALVVVGVWAVTGPLFGFSDTWQLVINTGTTIVTFLMVFLIQNTQNRDSQAIHAKLDELVVHMRGADNKLVEAEDLSDEELQKLKDNFVRLADRVEETKESRSKGGQASNTNGGRASRRGSQRGG